MSNTITPNLGLEIPAYGDPNWNNPFTVDMNLIDAAVGTLQTTVAGMGGGGTPAGNWTRYQLTSSGSNWLVNGVVVAARSSSVNPQQIALFTAPALTIFHAVMLIHTASFVGASDCTVSLGTAAIPDSLMIVSGDTFDIAQAPAATHFYLAGGARMLSTSATAIIAQVGIPSGSYPIVVTAGTLDIFVLCSTLPPL
jgi:hypothetical protein